MTAMEEAINFNKDNIFEYLFEILFNKNADLFGKEAENAINELNALISQKTNATADTQFDIEDTITRAMVSVSQYAFKSGFTEACRLNKTINTL
jgi:hypothetical protein